MSQSADVSGAKDAPSREEEIPEPITFTLAVVSPSVGVSSPLSFPHLPASTTVKELKAKIRDALPSKPVDESQRLIHRGRMLGRDTETMLNIFGPETLGNLETQTLHLVLRPTDGAATQSLTSAPIPVPPPPTISPGPPQLQPRPQSTPANPIQGMHAQQPLPGFQHVQQHQVLHQYEHFQNLMNQRLQQLQRETQRLHQEMGSIEQRHRAATQALHDQNVAAQAPMVAQFPQMGVRPPTTLPPPTAIPQTVQNLINQQQRERAAEGRQGAQDTGNGTSLGPVPPHTSSGRASPSLHRPDHTTTYTREGVGPNGERWHVTVNETTTTFPSQTMQPHHHHHHPGQHAHNPALDIQTVLRNADRFLATQAAQNMQRTASNSQTPTAPNPPGTASTVVGSNTPASVPTPATTNSSPSSSMLLNPAANALPTIVSVPSITAPSTSTEPMVYILSSPQGPRALLINNSETFFTPRQPPRRHQSPAPGVIQPQDGAAFNLPEFRNRPAQRAVRRGHRHRLENNPLEPVEAPHANPGAGALAAQIGPYIWLLVRLIGFVWFFSSGNPSWTRFFMVSGLALIVFLVNTGLFNGLADQLWGPVRRHLEALIPLAGPDAALVPAANAAMPQQPGVAHPAGTEAGQGGRPGEPDAAQIAARLIEQNRQGNGGWLMAQIRRAEHSLLLFLASLVPGVGERHIAAREAEATAAEAERQRRIEAAAATENPEGVNDGDAAGQAPLAADGGNQENQAPNPDGPADVAPAQPPITV